MEYSNEAEDKWYKWKGQKPPERTSHNITEEGIDELLSKNLAGHSCDWKQKGNIIYCEEGEYEHGKRIATNLRIAGTKPDGMPLLVPIGAVLRKDVDSA